MKKKTTSTTETTAVAEQGAQNAPEQAPSRKGASQKKGAPKAKQGAKQARASTKVAKIANPAAVAREGSKKAIVLNLLRRENGATLAEIMKATDWQAHSVRGFIAGALKKAGYMVESTKSETRERIYRLAQ